MNETGNGVQSVCVGGGVKSAPLQDVLFGEMDYW